MHLSSIPSDDLPPASLTSRDRILQWRLEETAQTYFYHQCDRITQALLSQCQWELVSDADALLLTIICPDVQTYWHIVSVVRPLAQQMQRLVSDQAVLRIIAPGESERSLDLSVEELLND